MEIDVEIVGLAPLVAKLELVPAEVAKAERKALSKAIRFVRDVLADQIPTGPGHFGGKHLNRALRIRTKGNIAEQRATLTPMLPQGRWLEFGTKPHTIRAHGRGLTENGQHFASVHHPGTKGQHLLRRTYMLTKGDVLRIFETNLREFLGMFGHGR